MKRKLLTIATVLLAAFAANAQDTKAAFHTVGIVIPEVALLDIEGAPQAITLTAVAPTEAGNAIDMSTATDATLWLNYSSIKRTSTDATRAVTAQVTTGTIPGGIDFKVVASADAGGGEGTLGTPSSILTLTNAAQNIITGVGSAYTGNGTSKGHLLTYSMVAKTGAAYGDIDADDSATLTVTYTLSDN
jgi:hypothetical protein